MQLRDDLLEPVSPDAPGGVELRYEPIYDQIKLARTEEDDIPQGDWERERKVADFGEVIELAQTALATQSKDLQLAAWLAEALLREHGFQGFLSGLTLIHELVDRYWDHLYPPLEDGDAEFRAMPLEWLGSYLDLSVRSVPLNRSGHSLLAYLQAQALGPEAEAADDKAKAERAAAIEEGKLAPEAFEQGFAATPKAWYKEQVGAIDGCLEAIAALDAQGSERFGRDAPSYSSLRNTIGEVRRVSAKLLERKLEIDPDPPEEASAIGPAVGTSGADKAPAGEVISIVPSNVADAAARIAEAARFLRQDDARNPAPYALIRGFRWAEIRRSGDPPDPRLIEAPPTEVRTRLKTLLLDHNWSALVEAGEGVMATPYGRGWLDLQRYVVTALTELGADYQPVRSLVLDSLAQLLRDLPTLPDQTMMDDSPTANRQTRDWLRAEGVWGDESEMGGSAAPVPTSPGASASGVIRQARTQARGGNPSKAVETLLHASERASHVRDGFLHRLEAASILVDQGLDVVARPLLDDMLKLIESHSLEGWESGDLVAEPLGLLYRVKTSAGQKADDLYERICRLDPVRAVQFQNEERQRAAGAESGAGGRGGGGGGGAPSADATAEPPSEG